MSRQLFSNLGFAFAWLFAISMVASMPFVVVSKFSEGILGNDFYTSLGLGAAAGSAAVFQIMINPMLSGKP